MISVLLGGGSPDPESRLHFSRQLDAPREQVFKLWTEPQHLARWWLPRHFTQVDIREMDVRPGGRLLIHMRTGEGNELVSDNRFHEVVAPERIVYRETCHYDGALFHRGLQTIRFHAQEQGTRLEVQCDMEWVDGRPTQWTPDSMRRLWQEGWQDNGQCMARYLDTLKGKPQ